MANPCEICTALGRSAKTPPNDAADRTRRVVVAERNLVLCRTHALLVRGARLTDAGELHALFREPAGRRSLVGRRDALDRRAFPPRPEGRRRPGGRRRGDAS